MPKPRPKFCPLNPYRVEGSRQVCMHDECAWWDPTDGICALKLLAYALDVIARYGAGRRA